jgi:hypothetical protein
VFWDGEGVRQFICHPDGTVELDHPMVLFGCTLGPRIKYVNLSSIDCLNLIYQVGKKWRDVIHVSFSFGWDVNQILKDLPIRALHVLREYGKVWFKNFHIEHVPRKWFIVRHNGIQVKIFDVFLFFNCKFGIALRKYEIGSDEELARIDAGKEERPNFTWLDIDEIETYWWVENQLGVQLMDKLRDIIYGAGRYISSWHGPGALASYSLRIHNTSIAMDKGIPKEINLAARYAMFGGRFQAFQAGFFEGPVFDRDINSAYAYAFSRLPSLANGKWRYDPYPDRANTINVRLGLYHIRYKSKMSLLPKPLPHRDKDGHVSFPSITEGWFHSSEAALVRNDPNAEFLGAWIFEDDGSYPFAWILDSFQDRIELQKQGNPSEKTIKWELAALYGQAAQRAGWDRTGMAPQWHQIEWAGAVTAECRSMLFMAASRAASSIVSMDTDGFISLAPVSVLPNGIGSNLGQWKATEFTGILYLQNGIYWLRDSEGKWTTPKSRGIPRKKLDFDTVISAIRQNESLVVNQHMFIGYGLALRGQTEKWRKWVDVPRTITFGGGGKAQHISAICPSCKAGKSYGDAMHPLYQVPPDEMHSVPYNIPWLSETEEKVIKDHAEVLQ